jgi:predicted O-linked N-acetylglucosamine transferase (SPINDLY family)
LQRARRRKQKRKSSLVPLRIHPKDALPQFVVRAHAAVKAGQVKEANRLFKENAAEVTEQLRGKNPLRTNIMLVLAQVLCLNRKYKMAEGLCRDILKIGLNTLIYNPALVYNMLGGICEKTGRLSEAIINLKKTTELASDFAGAWSNLGMALIRIGETRQGINLLRKAVEKDPKLATLRSNFLLYLNYLPDVDRQELFNEHKQWGRIHAPASLARASHSNVPDPDRKLRIGYISSDFRAHPVSYFFESFLDEHDRQEMEVCGYASVSCPDQVTQRLKSKFDHYRNICGVDDKVAADMIEQDQIDILVDLGGHTDSSRLLVLAYKPAPIQVAYLGYSNTTGMQTIDYRLTDSFADTEESQRFYTEKLVFLPKCFTCYKPPDSAPPVAPLPAIRKGYITFGSSNNTCKIHPLIIELWAEILKATGNSRILLRFRGGNNPEMRERYFKKFEQLGIPRERVEICGWKDFVEYLESYGQVDIALDTFPWNGHTTTCEALWMGVPTISLVGKAFVSRVGLSILSNVGLDSFATSTPEQYVAEAVSVAENLQALAKIRASMRQRMAAGVLCDAKRFARNVEAAYRKMWHRWSQSRELEVRGSANHRTCR